MTETRSLAQIEADLVKKWEEIPETELREKYRRLVEKEKANNRPDFETSLFLRKYRYFFQAENSAR